MYRCIPNDTALPHYTVPYEPAPQFKKRLVDLYVMIEPTTETHYVIGEHRTAAATTVTAHQTHIAILRETIGPVDDAAKFYEYQLRCRDLHNGPLFARLKHAVAGIVSSSDACPAPTPAIFSIDPPGCRDIDDAMSVDPATDTISVYIADVAATLSQYGLWPLVGDRVATVYMPHRNQPMLPTALSEHACSLRAGGRRPVLVMDVCIAADGTHVARFRTDTVTIARNWAYDDPALADDADYAAALRLVRRARAVADSHELVEWLMLTMNREAAKVLYSAGRGLFRAMTYDTALVGDMPGVDGALATRLACLASSSARYVALTPDTAAAIGDISHMGLSMAEYAQVTSPIRRLGDVLNCVALCQVAGLRDDAAAMAWYEGYMQEERIAHLNAQMRMIRRHQTACALLDLCERNPGVLERSWRGWTFGDSGGVWLPELGVAVSIKEAMAPFCAVDVRLFKFDDEARFKRKIRATATLPTTPPL